MSDNWGFGGSSFFDVIQGDSSGFGFETKKDSVENAEKREALKAEQKRAYGGHWEQFFWESVTEKQEREAKKAKLQEMEENRKNLAEEDRKKFSEEANKGQGWDKSGKSFQTPSSTFNPYTKSASNSQNNSWYSSCSSHQNQIPSGPAVFNPYSNSGKASSSSYSSSFDNQSQNNNSGWASGGSAVFSGNTGYGNSMTRSSSNSSSFQQLSDVKPLVLTNPYYGGNK